MISINLYELLFQVLNFVILLYLLRRFMAKPLREFIQARAKSIQSDIDSAAQKEAEASKLLADQSAQVKSAYQEAQDIRNNAAESAKKEREQVMAQAQADAEQLIAQAKKEIEQETLAAKESLKKDVLTLTVQLSEKLIGRSIDAEDADRIIQTQTAQ